MEYPLYHCTPYYRVPPVPSLRVLRNLGGETRVDPDVENVKVSASFLPVS